MDSIFPGTFNNLDPSTFAPEGINSDPMTFLEDDTFLRLQLENPPTKDMENPQIEARMIAADSMVTSVVWPGESSSSKQHEFAVVVDQVLALPDLASSSGVGHGFSMSQSDEAYGGTFRSSRDNSDKSDDNEIEGEIMEVTKDMVADNEKTVCCY
uniref:Uncharacterized protein n=1 Tax=Fagus sylvatica TaxID=28930 RepID=A0A2N9G8Y8_FAGSY